MCRDAQESEHMVATKSKFGKFKSNATLKMEILAPLIGTITCALLPDLCGILMTERFRVYRQIGLVLVF
jgi:hypothetical protein